MCKRKAALERNTTQKHARRAEENQKFDSGGGGQDGGGQMARGQTFSFIRVHHHKPTHTRTQTRTHTQSCGLNLRPGGDVVTANDNVEVEQTG